MKLSQFRKAVKISPKNGSVILRINWGYAYSIERVWLGLNDKDPVENAKTLFPEAVGFEFYDMPEKIKKGVSVGIGRPQSKKDI